MFKSIDILIGFSLIMLFISLAVTLLTQGLLTIRQARGKHLQLGLSELISQLDSQLDGDHAKEIAKMLLINPLINGGKVWKWTRYGDVIHRHEFIKLLFGLAINQPDADNQATGIPEKAAKKALKQFLADNGINDPISLLDKVNMAGLKSEQSRPELANDFRQDIALINEAPIQFLAKINLQFDPMMDRISERFTLSARFWTLISSIFIVVLLQLDALKLINDLATVDSAAFKPIFSDPRNSAEWWSNWEYVNIPGLFTSILLLSLGAPFWYSTLNKVLQLRSSLAVKDDIQRSIRQTEQTVEKGILKSSMNLPMGHTNSPDERGDLNQTVGLDRI